MCTSANGKHKNNGKILPALGRVRVTLKVHKVALGQISFPPICLLQFPPAVSLHERSAIFHSPTVYNVILAIEKVLN